MINNIKEINYKSRLYNIKSVIFNLLKHKKHFFLLILAFKLFSQFFELAALLLPLKIILLVSSNKKPLYLSQFSNSLSINDWAWIFLTLSISLLLLSILFDIIAKKTLRKFSLYLSLSDNFFNKPKGVLSIYLNNFFKMCAHFIQFIIGILFLFILFPLAIISWVFLATILLFTAIFLIRKSEDFRKILQLMLIDRRQLIRNITDFNFMIVFVFILVSFLILKENQEHVFLVLVSILVARRVFHSIAQGFNDFDKTSKISNFDSLD